jgi:hypothetical protein
MLDGEVLEVKRVNGDNTAQTADRKAETRQPTNRNRSAEQAEQRNRTEIVCKL